MWAQIGTRLLIFVPGSARVGVVYFDGGRVADGDEEEYREGRSRSGRRSQQIVLIEHDDDDNSKKTGKDERESVSPFLPRTMTTSAISHS